MLTRVRSSHNICRREFLSHGCFRKINGNKLFRPLLVLHARKYSKNEIKKRLLREIGFGHFFTVRRLLWTKQFVRWLDKKGSPFCWIFFWTVAARMLKPGQKHRHTRYCVWSVRYCLVDVPGGGRLVEILTDRGSKTFAYRKSAATAIDAFFSCSSYISI